MSRAGVESSADAVLVSISEEEMAAWRGEQGKRVVRHAGRWWWAQYPGFYRPVHLLARLAAREATRPARLCWGFHASLREADEGAANARLSVHHVADVRDYGESILSSNRRQHLRKARRRAEIVHLSGPDLLCDQGYDVLRSALARTGYGRMPSHEAYVARAERFVRPGRLFVLAGLVDGRLAGYVEGFAVDGVAYVEDVVTATEALSTQVSTALQFEFAEAARRSAGIHELVHGMHAVDDPALTAYKERIGFPVRTLPARVFLVPGTEALVRRRSPAVHYRLVGTGPQLAGKKPA